MGSSERRRKGGGVGKNAANGLSVSAAPLGGEAPIKRWISISVFVTLRLALFVFSLSLSLCVSLCVAGAAPPS